MKTGGDSVLERAKCLLSGQMLENISLLKMIEAYGENIVCSVIEQGQEWGVLLRLPTRHSPYDRVQYGDTEEIVFVAGNASACIGKLLDELTIHRPLLFKLQRVEYRRQIEQKFHLQKNALVPHLFLYPACNRLKVRGWSRGGRISAWPRYGH